MPRTIKEVDTHTNLDDPPGRVDGGTSKEYQSYSVRVWRAIRQSSPVLNHGTDNTHGAYIQLILTRFSVHHGGEDQPRRSHRTVRRERNIPTSTDLSRTEVTFAMYQKCVGYPCNLDDGRRSPFHLVGFSPSRRLSPTIIPKADFLQRPGAAQAAKGENCELMALVAVVHTAQDIARCVACRTHCGGVTTPLVEVCPA